MTNRQERFARVTSQVAFDYSPTQRARMLGEIRRRRDSQDRRRRWGATAAVVALLGGTGLVLRDQLRPAHSVSHRVSVEPEPTVLDDGCRISRASIDASWVVRTVTPERMHVELTSGRAFFEVTRRPERVFTVNASDVRVTVVGTRFWVEMRPGTVTVQVESGQVRVWRPGLEEKTLGAGEVHAIALARAASEVERAPPPRTPSGSPSKPSQGPPVRGSRTPLTLDQTPLPLDENTKETVSFEMLVKEGETAVREKRWADANRLWGQAVRDFPTEPRRSTVAFLRARLLLQELGDARAAAEAFAGIEAFGAPTALVEDALAREVEAWARAGVAVRARERAEAFIRRFPTSYRRSDVAAAGGLVPE